MWLRCNAWSIAIKPRDQSVARYSVCFGFSSPRYLHHLASFAWPTQASTQHLLPTTDSKNDSEVPTLRCPPPCWWGWSIFSLFCGQLSIFGSDLGFESKAFPNLEIKSRNCGQNMSVAVVACSSRLESVEWHDNALFRLSRRFSNRGLDLGNGTGTGKVGGSHVHAK